MIFLLRIQIENNKKNCFGVGEGAGVSEFFTMNPNLKYFLGGLGGRGGGERGGLE